ncbi:sensor histidine kinase [Alkalilimnicola ehrlichii MLHE-1]|uniref:histidine kinase n=1 Tax=Alkalilimnicola ehrlichii (strain ATCC BAA-1101 / DSM 17681 / MLHE-1) TaxID=187272 RepID=Q0AAV8_ALKEH|nr:sensor histidine kinase [Alkalilimnicola ehrlichii]ABI56029.1 Two-component sensor kinase CbrA [Alkalilimnicola ehrlichii MLHE-1]
MDFNLSTLFFSAAAYLLLLFVIAHGTERRWLPRAVAQHPLFYVLALGVYATTWSFYGSVGFAERYGIAYLPIYLGATIAFLLTPVLLMPLLRLTRDQQLTSLSDVFAFRFHSQAAGVLVTLLMLTGILPYIALQIRAVAESTQWLVGGETSPHVLAVVFCMTVAVFAIIFGARHVTPREKHTGLVVAIAFESVVKLAALMVIAWVAMSLAFDGPIGLNRWLADNPERLQAFYQPALDGPWISLLFLAFSAAFLLPRQFHMIFTENLKPRSLLKASWGFPAYLLALAICIPPILWAGQVLQPGTGPEYYVLGMAVLSESPVLVIVTYLGGISAASAMIIISTLALSSMTLNHLVLPLTRARPRQDLDLYATLRWTRRALILLMIAAGYYFFLMLDPGEGLVDWGLISFLAMAQFIPGIVGVLWWTRANVWGFIAGLLGGALVWLDALFLPALVGTEPFFLLGFPTAPESASAIYGLATFWSIAFNSLLFAAVSVLTPQTGPERQAAEACRDLGHPMTFGTLVADSPAQFVVQLAPVTGDEAARAEVGKALEDLGLDWTENRPDRLKHLRDQIERNLSGMMGPVLARMIVDERLELDHSAHQAHTQSIRQIEERLESSSSRFRGLTAELDRLRRYHRQILEDLPLGVITVTANQRIVRWNSAMQQLTGICARDALGNRLEDLAHPWGRLLGRFMALGQAHAHDQAQVPGDGTRWLSLHRTSIGEPDKGRTNDSLLLVEDVTELRVLERELAHSERLASIGRLAAGVAHEIGNPVTGVACLAQNLRDEDDPELIRESMEQILEQTHRISNIVHTLVSYAHAGSTEESPPEPVRLHDAAEEARQVMVLSRRGKEMEFDNRIPPHLEVAGDSQRLVQVFVNLFSNAADACAQQGRLVLTARERGDRIIVRVADNGPGIPASALKKVLDPFYTTKPAGQGTGLGLPLVYNIITDHGGTLDIESDVGGTTVTLELPALEGVA